MIGSNHMMPHVTCDDFRRQVWIDYFVVHALFPWFFSESYNPKIRQPSVKFTRGAVSGRSLAAVRSGGSGSLTGSGRILATILFSS